MSAAFAQTLWLIALAALVVLWARSRGAAQVGRAAALGALLLSAALSAAAAAAWGGLVGVEGLARVRTELAAPGASGPARARLFLRHVQLFWSGTPLRATVGYSPTAALQLPRDYGLDEAAASQDVFTLEDAGPRSARVEINVTPSSTTRVVDAVLAGNGDDPAAARRALVENGRCRRNVAPVGAADGGPQTTWVLLCTGDEPRALLAFERDLGRRDAAAADTPLRVTPWVWRGGAFRPHHVHLEPGTLLQIGASTDALPGVTLWQIPAPAGRPGLLFPPKNLLAPCAAWLEGNAGEGGAGGFFAPALGVLEAPPPAPAEAGAFACVLPFTPPFALEVRRLLPDESGIWLRSLWAALLLGAPAVVLLAAFASAKASTRTGAAFARVLAVAFVTASLAALLVVRLLLAHRLDMLRDYEPVGARVAANLAFTVLVAATLSGLAAAVGLAPAQRWLPRALLAACAWAVTVAVGSSAILAELAPSPSSILQAVASLLLASAPAWWASAVRAVPRLRGPTWASGDLAPLLLGLGAVGVVAVLGHALAPRAVPPKLAAAWTFVPLVYLAFRAVLGRPARAAVVTGAVVTVVLALLVRLDTGVAVAIAGAGLLVAFVTLAHDALFVDTDSRILDAFSRQARPFVTGVAFALLLGCAAIAIWAFRGLAAEPEDPMLPSSVTNAAFYVLLLAALLFVGAAAALRERAPRRATLWLVAGLVLVGAWAGRGLVVDRVLAGKSEASSRVAAILDPAYALLSDERAFAKGLTAWRETASPDGKLDGQGYFGAQLLDPGVLLSIDNDYLPVLLLRELGAGGLVRLAVLPLGLALVLWSLGAGRFPGGSASARVRRVLAALLGIVTLYQLVGSLGVLPFTGIAWPGLGIDSPSDLWTFVALLVFLALLGEPGSAPDRARVPAPTRRLVAAAAVATAVAGLFIAARAGSFALRRREPVEPTATAARLLAPFQGLEAVFDYVYRMQCPSATPAGIERPLLGDPDTPALRRFQGAFLSAWAAEEKTAADELARFRAGDKAACSGSSGHWRYEKKGGACRMTFKDGWPAVAFSFAEGKSSCDVNLADDVLRAFRYPLRRPYADARIRLVARATGAAAKDRGELVSGQVVVRLRPGAGSVDVSSARAGVYAAERVTVGEGVEVAVTGGEPTVRRPLRGKGSAKILVAQAPRVHLLEGSARWDTKVLDAGGLPTALGALSVIVVGGTSGRNVWLFRPTSMHPGDLAPTVDPLLADDVVSVLGSRRRQYVYGGLIPELGWVSPALADKSLGLDGWVHAAAARVEPGKVQSAPPEMCGTLAPPPAPDFARVCAQSPVDHVLECRVSLQPEVETRLRHLLELTAERPELFAPKKGFRPATNASFALLRGDSGEIVAQGTFVPGRESSAYAPATPSLEKYLIAARDDRDPVTGAPAPHEESGAEKADWPAAIAVGSTMKPLFARALERAAPDVAQRIVLTAAGKRSGCEAILGHCPPTKTLWNHTETSVDLGFFLAASVNWFQAAIGLLGTALPDGELGFGEGGPAVALGFPFAVEKADDAHRLWTRSRGREVIRADGTLDPTALRTTPFWHELEALLGRPLCTGSKDQCTRAADRRDLCAARALPIAAPSPDLRHLVATGPNGFDFSDGGPPRPRQLVKEYLQFLRGSGKHPLASTLQLADAFNRLFYDGGAAPYKLAASWFPVVPIGKAPAACTRATADGHTVAAGLCRALVDGTGANLKPGDDRVVLYGAKTGTIDSLGDIVEKKTACEAWNKAHTLVGAASQPYHLDCVDPGRNELNDSLFVVGFGVKQADGAVVPFTLALRYQRAGSVPPYGYAVYAVESFIDLVADYFAAG